MKYHPEEVSLILQCWQESNRCSFTNDSKMFTDCETDDKKSTDASSFRSSPVFLTIWPCMQSWSSSCIRPERCEKLLRQGRSRRRTRSWNSLMHKKTKLAFGNNFLKFLRDYRSVQRAGEMKILSQTHFFIRTNIFSLKILTSKTNLKSKTQNFRLAVLSCENILSLSYGWSYYSQQNKCADTLRKTSQLSFSLASFE